MFYRPVDGEISQHFGEGPTKDLPANHWIIQTFGNYQPDGHTGVDFACPVGTEIRAVTDGVVLWAGWRNGTYAQNDMWIEPKFAGYHYVIDHGDFIGIYGHGQDGGARVKVGQSVKGGQVIGLSGNTGGSTGPHLHFEILPNGWDVHGYMFGRINPEPLFENAAPVYTLDELFFVELSLSLP